MKLVNIKELKGTIKLRSGLHIGAGDTVMRIGGTDNPVVKHPHSQEPYIPGSSLKGKIRSLLEMRSGLMTRTDGAPLSLKDLNGLEGKEKKDCENILKLFGSSGSDSYESVPLGVCRVSFADCPLDSNWKEKAMSEHLTLTEVKSENVIDRIRGTAHDPRFIERVPAGAEFSFCISLKQLYEEENLEDFLLQGMKLLELDALGGNGSRGYGQVKFTFNNKEVQEKFDTITPF